VSKTLLEIQDLKAFFYVKAGTVKAVDGVSLTLDTGTKLGIVGESGSGKTTMALAIMRMIRPPGTIEGQIHLDGVDPVMRVKDQMVDGMRDHGVRMNRTEAKERVASLLETVDLSPRVAMMYPHELSGGMKQRVTVAMAIAMRPKLLIADEPTSALDVVIQRQVMDTITRLQKELGVSMILIGHDMGLMAQSVDRLAVMYAGRLVEVCDIRDLFEDPQHPYTKLLISSLPVLGNRGVFHGIPGIPPSVINPPPGCPFFVRCPSRIEGTCEVAAPKLIETKPGRWVSCYLYNGGGK
jgi:oligopeptide/dipeptide ABC transporter ATP-binding protein